MLFPDENTYTLYLKFAHGDGGLMTLKFVTDKFTVENIKMILTHYENKNIKAFHVEPQDITLKQLLTNFPHVWIDGISKGINLANVGIYA